MHSDLLNDSGIFAPATDPFAQEFGSTNEMLNAFLERQRATFAWKLSQLTTEQLRNIHEPTRMTLAGMLKHMARYEDDMSTEFILGNAQMAPWNEIDWQADREWDWRTALEEDADMLYARWVTAVRHSREIVLQAIQSNVSATPLPYVLANSLEEYARHNGQIDLIREAIDGTVGHDPPTIS